VCPLDEDQDDEITKYTTQEYNLWDKLTYYIYILTKVSEKKKRGYIW